MKKYLWIGFLVLVGMVGLLSIASASISVNEMAGVIFHPYDVKTYPDPAVPGNVVRIEVDLTNYGQESVYNISTKLEPTDPFKGIKTDGFVQRLNPGERTTVVYVLNLSSTADPGKYTINHFIKYYYGEWNEKLERTDYFKSTERRTIGINVENRERLEIKSLSISPSELLPGQIAEITAKIKNSGNVGINNAKVSLKTSRDDVMALPPSEVEIDYLGPGEEQDVKFKIRATNLVSSGICTGTISLEYLGKKTAESFSLSLAKYPAIDITRIWFEKQPEPGKETKMHVEIKNMGQSTLRGFSVSLMTREQAMMAAQMRQSTTSQSSTGNLLTPTSSADINEPQPVAVISDSSKYVEKLEAGQSLHLDFDIAFSDNVKEGPYPIYISIQGGDFNGITQAFSINLKGVPRLSISDLDTSVDIVHANEPFKLSLQLENEGTGNAKNVIAKLGDEVVYLGSIDSGDTSTASFRQSLKKTGINPLTIVVTYYDKYDNQYKQEFNVDVRVMPKPFPWSLVLGVLAVIVIIGFVIVYLWRRRS